MGGGGVEKLFSVRSGNGFSLIMEIARLNPGAQGEYLKKPKINKQRRLLETTL